MDVLVLGLYAEGHTDERFLPVIIQRTAEQILLQHQQLNIEVLTPLIIEKASEMQGRDNEVLQAAREAEGYDVLVIHSDSDNRTREQTLQQRFEPGKRLVQSCNEKVCRNLVPIITVRMVEAWLLADNDTLRNVLGTNLNARELELPEKAKQIEAHHDPKHLIELVVRKVYPNQSHQWARIRGELYARLAPRIRLEQLERLEAYKQFKEDLTDTLRTLKKISTLHQL